MANAFFLAERAAPRGTAMWAHLKIESGSRETRQGRQAGRTRERRARRIFVARATGHPVAQCFCRVNRHGARKRTAKTFAFESCAPLIGELSSLLLLLLLPTAAFFGPVVFDFRTVWPPAEISLLSVM